MNANHLTPDDLLSFWFGTSPDDGEAMTDRFSVWFTASPAFDADVRARFTRTVERARAGELDDWGNSARGTLAHIIALDQLPRNIYRGTARAFATDARAIALTTAGMERGFDRQLRLIERVFFYLPFEHAEDPVLQDRCLALFRSLDAVAPPALQVLTGQCVASSTEHRDVIRRFGRFPNRNGILGRASSAAEQAWIAAHDGWGQSSGA